MLLNGMEWQQQESQPTLQLLVCLHRRNLIHTDYPLHEEQNDELDVSTTIAPNKIKFSYVTPGVL